MSDNGSLIDRKFGNPSPNKRSVSKRTVSTKADREDVPSPRMPVEWCGSSNWRLPSGKALAEFAFESGFLAPLLFKTDVLASTGLASLGSELSHRSPSGKKEKQA